MKKERHLARCIFVNKREYKLSIAEIERDNAGNIRSLRVVPFVKEEAGVTYHDRNLSFVTCADGLWRLEEA